MLKRIYLLLILLTTFAGARAQDSQPILTIDGKNVYAADLLCDFSDRIMSSHEASTADLLSQYADFRAMVCEARRLRLDTTREYRNAVLYYEKEMMCNHITSGTNAQTIINGILSHSQYIYNVAYIRINILANSHGDSLAAYRKALQIRSMISSGKDMERLARQMSDDPNAKINGGYLGWVQPINFRAGLNVCNYIYKHFDDTASVSEPLRSGNSYYLIKLGGRANAIDSVEVSPIIISKKSSVKTNDSIKSLFANIEQQLLNGASFGELQLKYSDIKFSEFISLEDAYAKYSTHLLDHLGKDSYSGIIETSDYICIAKINRTTSHKGTRRYRRAIIDRIAGNPAYQEMQGKFLDSIKAISQYSMKGSLQPIARLMPDSAIFEAQWNPGDVKHLQQTLFTFAGQNYTYADFATYIYNTQYPTGYSKIPEYVSLRYQNYLDELLNREAHNYLKSKNAEYGTGVESGSRQTLQHMLRRTKDYPKRNPDTASVMEFYRQTGKHYQTSHVISMRLYNYGSPSNKKKVMKVAEDIAADSTLVYPMAPMVEKGVYQLGDNPVTDIIIEGFDEGRYKMPQDRIIYLDHINSLAVVGIEKNPEELSKSEIFSVVSPKYKMIYRSQYMSKLRERHHVEIAPNAESALAAALENINQ